MFPQQTCHSCGAPGMDALILLDQQGIPPGEDGHVITYSHLAAAVCPVCGHGQVESLDHDCFDYEDVWDWYEWYVLSPADTSQLRALVAACPHPLVAGCDCPVHSALRDTCRSLPHTAWHTSLQAEEHVHRVTLTVQDGRPKINKV